MTEINPRDSVQDLINLMSVKKRAAPALIVKKLTDVYNSLEDVYSVSNASELQSSIDTVGTSAATLFLEAGTHTISTAIDVDGGGSLIIYGHGDQTILEVADGVSAFNITSCSSLTIKNLKIDCSNYSSDTQAILINEASDNVVIVDDVTIVGDGTNGIGIEIQSNNCRIENCSISSCSIGIHVNSSNSNLMENNIITSMNSQGLKITDGDYSTINSNTLNSNVNGMYLTSADNNFFSGNVMRLNTQNGIYLTGSNKNKFLGNVIDSNDSNTANAQAGIYITSSSSNNIMKDNTITDNNNSGAGTSFGIYINNSNCSSNVALDNTLSGNDIIMKDIGSNSNIEYKISNATDLQDSIDSIGSKSGKIILDIGTITLTQAIDIDGGGKYIIEGQGDTTILDINGDYKCFNITSVEYLHLKDIKIDASDLTTSTMEIIDVTEASNNNVILENITITGDGSNGYGIEANSQNVSVKNCNIDNVNRGINILTNNTSAISKNTITSCNHSCVYLSSANYNKISNNSLTASQYGIYVDSSDENTFSNNVIRTNTLNGAFFTGSDNNTITSNTIDSNDSNTASSQAGIYIDADSNSNILTDNTITNNNNSGAGTCYGIYIANSNCDKNISKNNVYSGNDNNWKDDGTNTDIEYSCYTAQDIQDAIDSIAAKAGTIKLELGTYTLSQAIDVDGGASLIIEGNGNNTILDVNGDFKCFNVTSTASLIFRNFKITADDVTATTPIFYIAEASDNNVSLDTITIIGDTTDQFGYGVQVNSANVTIKNCNISYVSYGVYNSGTGSDMNVQDCNIIETSNYAIYTSEYNFRIERNYFENVKGALYTTSSSGRNYFTGNELNLCTEYGIYLNQTSDIRISLNYMYGNITDRPDCGIYAYRAGSTWIHDNYLYYFKYSIYLIDDVTETSWYNIYNNTFIGGKSEVTDNACIYLRGVSSSIIQGNLIRQINGGGGNGYGILCDTGYVVELRIEGNEFNTDNDAIHFDAEGASYIDRIEINGNLFEPPDSTTATIYLEDVVHTNITGNQIISYWSAYSTKGIYLNGSEYINITGNSFKGYRKNEAIYLTGSSHNLISSNSINEIHSDTGTDRGAVYLCSSSNYNNITSNSINDNDDTGAGVVHGIYIDSCEGNSITGNLLNGNEGDGIRVVDSDNTQINGNSCCGNGFNGIYISGCSNGVIGSNICNDNDCNSASDFGGIVLAGNSDQNTITGNTCNNNNNAGAGDSYGINISAATCDENTVSGNTCLGNDSNYNDSGTNTYDNIGGTQLNNVA